MDSKLIGTFPKYLEWNEMIWNDEIWYFSDSKFFGFQNDWNWKVWDDDDDDDD